MERTIAQTRDLIRRGLQIRAEIDEADLAFFISVIRGDLTGADLSFVDLDGLDLDGFILAFANLTEANLTNAFLRRTDLRGAAGLTPTQRAYLKQRGAIV